MENNQNKAAPKLRPTWVNVVGAIALVFGVLGVTGGVEELAANPLQRAEEAVIDFVDESVDTESSVNENEVLVLPVLDSNSEDRSQENLQELSIIEQFNLFVETIKQGIGFVAEVENKIETKGSIEIEITEEELNKNVEKLGEFLGDVDQAFEVPAWLQKWYPLINLLTILVSALYLGSGVFLLTLKTYAPKFFMATVSLSTTWVLLSMYVYSKSTWLIFWTELPGAVISVVIDVVLLVVVAKANKEIFEKPEELG